MVQQTPYQNGAISKVYKNFGNLLISFAQIYHCAPRVSHNSVYFNTKSTDIKTASVLCSRCQSVVAQFICSLKAPVISFLHRNSEGNQAT